MAQLYPELRPKQAPRPILDNGDADHALSLLIGKTDIALTPPCAGPNRPFDSNGLMQPYGGIRIELRPPWAYSPQLKGLLNGVLDALPRPFIGQIFHVPSPDSWTVKVMEFIFGIEGEGKPWPSCVERTHTLDQRFSIFWGKLQGFFSGITIKLSIANLCLDAGGINLILRSDPKDHTQLQGFLTRLLSRLEIRWPSEHNGQFSIRIANLIRPMTHIQRAIVVLCLEEYFSQCPRYVVSFPTVALCSFNDTSMSSAWSEIVLTPMIRSWWTGPRTLFDYDATPRDLEEDEVVFGLPDTGGLRKFLDSVFDGLNGRLPETSFRVLSQANSRVSILGSSPTIGGLLSNWDTFFAHPENVDYVRNVMPIKMKAVDFTISEAGAFLMVEPADERGKKILDDLRNWLAYYLRMLPPEEPILVPIVYLLGSVTFDYFNQLRECLNNELSMREREFEVSRLELAQGPLTSKRPRWIEAC